ncbi:hypothetical protein [Halosimplex halobium]|uniref:hypothetical protein n=1 Tax=Halosimplex halobium TaxID=3396618 RepID=UPI003F55157F
MHDIPGGSCGCSERYGGDADGHDHDHGDSGSTTDAESGSASDDDTCDDCGAAYEWRLDLDGVQHYDCPNCDA